MSLRPCRVLQRAAAVVLLCVLSGSSASASPLPPEIVSTSQSSQQVPARGSTQLGVTASDPQGSALTFTWSSIAGALGTPVHGPDTSQVSWTAPDCLAPGSLPVRLTVTNAHGLTANAAFAFTLASDLYADRQPPFTTGQLQLRNVTLTSSGTLAYQRFMPALSSEKILFPEDQRLSLSFVRERAWASHSLGWLYYDDLVARGYVDTRGTPDSSDDTLVDANANGITDLHEDLYNLAPPSGAQARPYVGTGRRCARTFTSGGVTYSQPDLALNSTCASAFMAGQFLQDARPDQNGNYIPVDVLGAPSTQPPGTGFSDRGLYARIPNLLEPADAANGHMGLGKLVFLLTDDDEDRSTYKELGPVADMSSAYEDGLPDYDVSAYDATGLPRPYNPDPGLTGADRTVDLGIVQGGREMVFFLVTHFDDTHEPQFNGTVYPCLRKAPDGRCTLHLRTSTSVFFSKSQWNLDQDPRGTPVVAERNMGCASDDRCDPYAPYSYACTVAGTTQRLCGWLDPVALYLLGQPAYGSLVLPREAVSVPAPGHANMPHVSLGAPSTASGSWLLAFEDLNGGGNRSFADVVFLLRAEGGTGAVRSPVLNDSSPAAASSCNISRVRFRKEDSFHLSCGSQSPFIRYAVATDCRLCSGDSCQVNPTPTWHPVPLGAGTGETLLDVSTSPGSQLCWKADLTAPTPACQLSISNVDVGYELTPAP